MLQCKYSELFSFLFIIFNTVSLTTMSHERPCFHPEVNNDTQLAGGSAGVCARKQTYNEVSSSLGV